MHRILIWLISTITLVTTLHVFPDHVWRASRLIHGAVLATMQILIGRAIGGSQPAIHFTAHTASATFEDIDPQAVLVLQTVTTVIPIAAALVISALAVARSCDGAALFLVGTAMWITATIWLRDATLLPSIALFGTFLCASFYLKTSIRSAVAFTIADLLLLVEVEIIHSGDVATHWSQVLMGGPSATPLIFYLTVVALTALAFVAKTTLYIFYYEIMLYRDNRQLNEVQDGTVQEP